MLRIPALLTLLACAGTPSDDSGNASDDSGSTSETGETGETGETAAEAVACTLFDPPDVDSSSALPDTLSLTGCFDPADPWLPVDDLLPYALNVPFWSDNAEKTRYAAIPAGGKIEVAEDGDLYFPVGTTLVKHFMLDGIRVETRLFIQHDLFRWTGYSYQWNEEQTDATLLEGSATRDVAGQTWIFPSRSECLACHSASVGGALGPEIGQLNRDFDYADGTENQLVRWQSLGLFEVDPGAPATLAAFANPDDTSAALEDRARSYLHVNCAQCHRPGGASHLPTDWRIDQVLDSTTCNAVPNNNGGNPDARLLVPGDPDNSLIYTRPADPDWRMPPLGSNVIHTDGVALIGEWITSLTSCPPSN
jgi:uncharacterized repeat protein (TIGR03806 family)